MAESLDPETARKMERRSRVVVGSLPTDFLRAPGSSASDGTSDPSTGEPLTAQQIQERMDEQAALALHQQLNLNQNRTYVQQQPTNIRGRLLISVMQAKLIKNYGMTRMDPYVRIHIGHNIYETPTDVNGAKNPRWNKTIQCFLPMGINQIYLEIYDECNFSVDELVAHSNITIPEDVFKGETIEEWYPLNGKQGEGKEGQILLVFSFMAAPPGSVGPAPPMSYVQAPGGVTVVAPGYHTGHGGSRKHPQVFQSTQPVSVAVQPPAPTFNEEDFKQLKEMFPNIEDDVVRSIYEASGFKKDAAADGLLGISE